MDLLQLTEERLPQLMGPNPMNKMPVTTRYGRTVRRPVLLGNPVTSESRLSQAEVNFYSEMIVLEKLALYVPHALYGCDLGLPV